MIDSCRNSPVTGPRRAMPKPHRPGCGRISRMPPVRGALMLAAGLLLLLPASGDACGQATPRPRVGVALGGGSARGLAHIGLIAWFEEHHIPIDVLAGTSMGGLVGGAYATGMSAEELSAMIVSTDWDAMFGSTSFPFKNIRRKVWSASTRLMRCARLRCSSASRRWRTSTGSSRPGRKP